MIWKITSQTQIIYISIICYDWKEGKKHSKISNKKKRILHDGDKLKCKTWYRLDTYFQTKNSMINDIL